MFEKIYACARGLISLGVTAGDIITIQTLTMPQSIILIYAINKIGAVANLIYATATEQEVCNVLIETKSKVYITIDRIVANHKNIINNFPDMQFVVLSVADEMDMITKTIYLCKNRKFSIKGYQTIDWKTLLRGNKHITISDNLKNSKEPAVMVQTGGTTGKPKAVVLSDFNLNAIVCQYNVAGFGYSRQSVFLNPLPIFIAFGLTVCTHVPLVLGMKTVIIVNPHSPSDIANSIRKCKPNYLVLGTAQLNSILSNQKLRKCNLQHIQMLATGGDTVSRAAEMQVNRFLKDHNSNAKLIVGYGMTEMAATVCTNTPNAIKPETIGIPLPKANVKIIDSDTQSELRYNEQGEICINTPSIMQKYFNDIEETNAVLKRHDDGKLWIHTADIGSIDEEGFIHIVGRDKRTVLTYCNNIFHKVYPNVLEEKLENVVGVQAAVVVGVPSATANILIAFIISELDEEEQIRCLNTFLNEKLEVYERPERFVFLDSIPRTTIGKVDYRKLEEMASDK